MTPLNKYQPTRSRFHPTRGWVLQYRTFPDMRGKRIIRVNHFNAQICQARLYRATFTPDFPQRVLISEFRDYLFGNLKISSRQLGITVLNSLLYDPRVLVNNRSVEKISAAYGFKDVLELRYGLEWQICVWLRRLLLDVASLAIKNKELKELPDLGSDDKIEIELDKLAKMTDNEYARFERLIYFHAPTDEPDWVKLTKGLVEDVPTEEEKVRILRGV